MGDSTKRPKAIASGTLFEGRVDCYVLDSGMRAISQRGIIRGFGGPGKGDLGRYLERLPDKFKHLSLDPVLEFELPQGGIVAIGREATWLIDLCQAYVDAFFAGELHIQQQGLAQKASIILKATAKVGIIALVDEATGYRAEKEDEKYSTIFKKLLVNSDPREWTKTFQDELREQMKRLKVPAPWGHQLRKLVYAHLPGGQELLSELDMRNPRIPGYGRKSGVRKEKHHQFLSEDAGILFLKNQLLSVVTLMETSDSYADFLVRFHKKFPEDRDDTVRILRAFDGKQLQLFESIAQQIDLPQHH